MSLLSSRGPILPSLNLRVFVNKFLTAFGKAVFHDYSPIKLCDSCNFSCKLLRQHWVDQSPQPRGTFPGVLISQVVAFAHVFTFTMQNGMGAGAGAGWGARSSLDQSSPIDFVVTCCCRLRLLLHISPGIFPSGLPRMALYSVCHPSSCACSCSCSWTNITCIFDWGHGTMNHLKVVQQLKVFELPSDERGELPKWRPIAPGVLGISHGRFSSVRGPQTLIACPAESADNWPLEQFAKVCQFARHSAKLWLLRQRWQLNLHGWNGLLF